MPFCSSATNFNATHKVSKLHRAPSFVHEFSTGIKNAVSNIEGKPFMVDQISSTISTSSELHNLQSCFEWMENCWNTGIFAENLIQNEELLNEDDPGDCSVPSLWTLLRLWRLIWSSVVFPPPVPSPLGSGLPRPPFVLLNAASSECFSREVGLERHWV